MVLTARKPPMPPRWLPRAKAWSRVAHFDSTASKNQSEKMHNRKSCPCMFLSKEVPIFRLRKQNSFVLLSKYFLSNTLQTQFKHLSYWIFWTVKYLESQSLVTFYPEIKTGCTAKAEFQNTSLGMMRVSLGNVTLCRPGKKGETPYLFWGVCPLLLGKA